MDVASADCQAALQLVEAMAQAAGGDSDDVIVWYEDDGSGGSILVMQTPVTDETVAVETMRFYEAVLGSGQVQSTIDSAATFDAQADGAAYLSPNPYIEDTGTDDLTASVDEDGDDGDDENSPVGLIVGIVVGLLALAVAVGVVYCCGCCGCGSRRNKKKEDEESDEASLGKRQVAGATSSKVTGATGGGGAISV